MCNYRILFLTSARITYKQYGVWGQCTTINKIEYKSESFSFKQSYHKMEWSKLKCWYMKVVVCNMLTLPWKFEETPKFFSVPIWHIGIHRFRLLYTKIKGSFQFIEIKILTIWQTCNIWIYFGIKAWPESH